MLEAELKVSLAGIDEDALLERMAALGFAPAESLWERDVYYNGERDFRRTDEALRLRSAKVLPDGPETCFLTYKGPKLDAVSSARMEYETAVGDEAAAGKILEALGYRPAAVVEKRRRQYRLDHVTLCLDRVTGLGPYLELETLTPSEAQRAEAVEALLALLDQLEIPRDRLTRRSYLGMLEDGGPEKEEKP